MGRASVRKPAVEPRPADVPESDLYDWRTFDPESLPGGINAPLARELVTFRDRLDEMVKDHEGKFVVIKGDRIVGYHRSREAALRAAYKEFGRELFLLKQVLDKEPIKRFGSVLL